MSVSEIIAVIDAEILKLQQARALLAGTERASVSVARGRPKGSKNVKTATKAAKTERKLSPEGRKRIADAMKKRWADRRKQIAKS